METLCFWGFYLVIKLPIHFPNLYPVAKFSFLLLLITFSGCSTATKDLASDWIEKTNIAHGTTVLDHTSFRFTFREYTYGLTQRKYTKYYSRTKSTPAGYLTDTLYNGKDFKRWINQKPVKVSDSLQKLYSESINSVLYFMQLPKVLKDAAVQAHYLGEEDLLGEPYVRLKVTFQQAGGGVDYQDEYRYWIHKKTHLLDFLAYRFYSGKGGTRFRKASHRKHVNGMIFQNYENFSPPTPFPPLDSIASLYTKGKLKKISDIQQQEIYFLMP